MLSVKTGSMWFNSGDLQNFPAELALDQKKLKMRYGNSGKNPQCRQQATLHDPYGGRGEEGHPDSYTTLLEKIYRLCNQL
jgi:hypothetical protein